MECALSREREEPVMVALTIFSFPVVEDLGDNAAATDSGDIQERVEGKAENSPASKLMLGFIKTVSFPSCGSRARKSVRPRNHKKNLECGGEDESQVDSAEQLNSHSETLTDLSSDDDVGKHMLRRAESFDNAEKRHRESKLILNRFKNLKQKIQHALEESRKEASNYHGCCPS
ncbi:hypothetical protein K7X08_014341 [Anisodus acutangulus]|uniref:Uncharacterized protein n=1 Tax=Anisodus acutangulus TaxID=402998 RepID=A0A9Q1LL11_9SOLA|nr:hypothetical protein K7X08_014341 [Anisodus acutangulus]